MCLNGALHDDIEGGIRQSRGGSWIHEALVLWKAQEKGENKKLAQEGKSGSHAGDRAGDKGRGGEGEDDTVLPSWDTGAHQCPWVAGPRTE